jgi:undecaprenyl-diphosphatase
MALADRRPSVERSCREAGPRDGLALGLAQALALIPGVSRSGATLTAARARGFGRGAAHALAWDAALPVLLGASVLEAARLARSGAALDGAAAVGGATAFVSTLASARLLARRPQALLPYAVYRLALAGLLLGRWGRERP